ncbi:hypothetical protein SPKIRA_00100 [Sphingomonas paucimobilis]|nr:hypothetical protein SPKIRA_00100 [Sphingomonas paucimobilis]
MRASAGPGGEQIFNRTVRRLTDDEPINREAERGQRGLQHVENAAVCGGDAVGADQGLGQGEGIGHGPAHKRPSGNEQSAD